jgi:cytochrome c oxidase subunit 6a
MMFQQRLMLRAAAQLRSPIARRVFQRRLASTEQSGFPDNAFNRERKAVKDHAAASSGEFGELT